MERTQVLDLLGTVKLYEMQKKGFMKQEANRLQRIFGLQSTLGYNEATQHFLQS